MLGPIMFDVQGTSLNAEDKELLAHPLIGGVILFSRNYQDPEQVHALCDDIKKHSTQGILIAVDHEGGRVQRFREHFSVLPAMGELWSLAEQNLVNAQQLAFHSGVIMALEVQAVGVDISFAPVLDVNGISEVIGDRAFHADPEVVTELAMAFIRGMKQAGMLATGKHFPGHGSVQADSHIALPIDEREPEQILEYDLVPFKKLIAHHALNAIMPAHVIYPKLDQYSVGFSQYWLQQVLRQQLNFNGVIFSDDLSMAGAASIGGYIERAEAAQQAGCDMLLVCNTREAVIDILDNANITPQAESQERLKAMLAKPTTSFSSLASNPLWQQAHYVLGQRMKAS